MATIPPIHPSQETGEAQEPKKWRYSQSGFNCLSEGGTREEDRSRTPLHTGKRNDDPKGKGAGKKGKKPAKIIGTPEGEETERVGEKYFPGPATLPESWREKKPEEIIMSGTTCSASFLFGRRRGCSSTLFSTLQRSEGHSRCFSQTRRLQELKRFHRTIASAMRLEKVLKLTSSLE